MSFPDPSAQPLQDLNASLHTVVGNDKYEFAQRLVGAGLPNASAMALVQLEEGLVQFLDGSESFARAVPAAARGSAASCQDRVTLLIACSASTGPPAAG